MAAKEVGMAKRVSDYLGDAGLLDDVRALGGRASGAGETEPRPMDLASGSSDTTGALGGGGDGLPADAGGGTTAAHPSPLLARFAQAAYSSEAGRATLDGLTKAGWTPLKPQDGGLTPVAEGEAPWFEQDNAQALTAVRGDTMVLSFRGTDELGLGAPRGVMEYVLKEQKGWTDSDLQRPYRGMVDAGGDSLTDFGASLRDGAAAVQALFASGSESASEGAALLGSGEAASRLDAAYANLQGALSSRQEVQDAADTLWDFVATMVDELLVWVDDLAAGSTESLAKLRFTPYPFAEAIGTLAHAADEAGAPVWDTVEKGVKVAGMASLADWASYSEHLPDGWGRALASAFGRDDSYHWIEQGSHYDKFDALKQGISSYLADGGSGIDALYVTGHSLGAGMASWFLADDGAHGAQGLKESADLSQVAGASFAPPAMVYHGAETDPADTRIPDGIPYQRFEVARDVVPDVVDVTERGEGGEHWVFPDEEILRVHSANPGTQANIMSTYSALSYTQGLPLHSMEHYKINIRYLAETGLVEDWAFASHEKDILDAYGANGRPDGQWDPILVKELGATGRGATLTGNQGGSIREFKGAERWSPENDVLVGTDRGDTLVGKSGDDLLYAGGGNDRLYGDEEEAGLAGRLGVGTALAPGRDVAALSPPSSFWEEGPDRIQIESSASPLAEHRHKAELDLGASEKQLYGIEAFHFIEEPSPGSDLLVHDAGYRGADTLDGGRGDDFLVGAHDQDSDLRGGAGDDRIHGGAGVGTDTVHLDGSGTGDYEIRLEDWGLALTEEATGETDRLYDVEALDFDSGGIVDTGEWVRSVLGSDAAGGGLEEALLTTYSPVFGYAGSESPDSDLSVKGDYEPVPMGPGGDTASRLEYQVTIGADAGLGGRGPHEFNFGIRLGEDFLPQGLYGEFPQGLYGDCPFGIRLGEGFLPQGLQGLQGLYGGLPGLQDEVQVRHPFSPEVATKGNHPVVWLDDGGAGEDHGSYLTPSALPDGRDPLVDYDWLVPDGSLTSGHGELTFSSNTGEESTVDVSDDYDLVWAGNGTGDIDLAGDFFEQDLYGSTGYASPFQADTLAEVRRDRFSEGFEGDMEMGYLFQGTELAKLGDFDVA